MNALIDQYQRKITYLRLSVTDKCDLRCLYCMPDNNIDYAIPDEWLNFEEIIRIVKAFTELGVSSVRITGGEPLLRKNLTELTTQLHQLPQLSDLSLSTNATRLDRFADALAKSGVRRLNVSLDTINPKKFTEITRGKIEKIIRGLLAAKEAGIHPIKINMVLMKGVNDGDDVEQMLEFCMQHDFALRFIETMPMGDTGRAATTQFVSLKAIEQRLTQKYQLIPAVMFGAGPARYLQFPNSNTKIGFITPLSQHFCETCNRVRLSVTGELFMCLGDEHKLELRPLLRQGIDDEALKQTLVHAINLKPYKHEFIEKPDKVIRFMSRTGG